MTEVNPNPNPNPNPAPWHDGIDAETIGHWDNKGWKKEDPKALATELTKAWKGLEKHFGAPADQILRLPKDNADEAGWASVRERLGMPKEAKDYDFTGIKRASGADLDQAFTDTMRGALHKAGVSKDAAGEIVKSVIGHLDGVEASTASERAATLVSERVALAKQWNTTPDGLKTSENMLHAKQGARRLGIDAETINNLEGLTGYSKLMDALRKIGYGTTEDTFHDNNQGGNPTTVNGALARRAELEGDKEWVARYMKGGAKERQEMMALQQIITGVAA